LCYAVFSLRKNYCPGKTHRHQLQITDSEETGAQIFPFVFKFFQNKKKFKPEFCILFKENLSERLKRGTGAVAFPSTHVTKPL